MTDITSRPPDDEPAVSPAVSLLEGEEPLDASGLDNETANALQTAGTGRSIARATAGIVPLHIVRFVIGFVAQPLIARNFGLSPLADVYAVSTDILQRIWLLFEKVVNPAFLPCFIGALKEENEERAWRFASTAIWITLFSLLVVGGAAWYGMPAIIRIYSDKTANNPEIMRLTEQTARYMLGGLLFLGFSSLTYTILNGYKRFALAALGDTLWKLGIMFGAVAALKLHNPQKALIVIVAGYVVGAFFKLFPHLLGIGGKWRLLRPRIDLADPLVRKMVLLAVPLILGIVVSEARGVYLQRLADSHHINTEAGRAALKWARIIPDNLVQIFPYALSIGIFPYLAELARDRDRQPLTDTLLGALRVCFFTFLPLTAILIALCTPLLSAVWESGKFGPADTLVLSFPYIAFTLGLIGFSCEMMLNQTFYAMTNAWTPTLVGVGTTVLWIIVARAGVEAQYGLAAIAGAESLSKSVKCLVMWTLLRPQLGDIKRRDNIVFFVKLVAASAIAALFAWLVVRGLVHPGGEHHKLKMLLSVTIAGCAGLVAFLVGSAVLRIEEVGHMGAFIGKLRKRLSR